MAVSRQKCALAIELLDADLRYRRAEEGRKFINQRIRSLSDRLTALENEKHNASPSRRAEIDRDEAGMRDVSKVLAEERTGFDKDRNRAANDMNARGPAWFGRGLWRNIQRDRPSPTEKVRLWQSFMPQIRSVLWDCHKTGALLAPVIKPIEKPVFGQAGPPPFQPGTPVIIKPASVHLTPERPLFSGR